MYKVMKTFICRGCVIPVTGIGRKLMHCGAYNETLMFDVLRGLLMNLLIFFVACNVI